MLYPELEPYKSEFLNVSHGHRIHYQMAGNPDGIPVIYIHGGPGGGLHPGFARFFDPNLFHIIGFDQRGCGKSSPWDDLEHNTTSHLLEDIVSLRNHLGIKKWVVFGGSWGATLALLLAIKEPQCAQAVILRGTFLGRKTDIDWFLCPNGGAASLFPDYYAKFIEPISQPPSSKALCKAFMQEFQSNNEIRRTSAIRAWFQWEERLSRLTLPTNYSSVCNTPLSVMTSMAILECHYLSNDCFLEDNYILNHMDTIASIPGIIIHGRYDSICSTAASYELHNKWKNSELNIVPAAGHSTAEPGISSALCQATRQVAKFIRQNK
jgi:proline iminopeptidase